MRKDFLETFDELLHNYIAEGNFEDIHLNQQLAHIDGNEYEVHLTITKK